MLLNSRKGSSFGTINLIGKCNLNCFYCKGNSIDNKINHLTTHFREWKNFCTFIRQLKERNISNVYIKGINTDPSLYAFLDPLIVYLVNNNFYIGIKTSGYVDITHLFWFMNGEVTYTINTLDRMTNYKLSGTYTIPNWNYIITNSGKKVNVSIVVNRYNVNEVKDIINYLYQFDNINEIQINSVPNRKEFQEDINCYNIVYNEVKGMDKVVFKQLNSVCDYYTDGTIENEELKVMCN